MIRWHPGARTGYPVLFLCGLLLHGSAPAQEPAIESRYAAAARLMNRQIIRLHLRDDLSGESVRDLALEAFLATLDPGRSVFMAADVEAFRDAMPTPDSLAREGDLSLAHAIYDQLIERLDDRKSYVASLLEEGLRVRTGEVFAWDRRRVSWPDGREDWDALWRRKVKNRLIGALVARTLAEEETKEEGNGGAEAPSGSALRPPPERTPEEDVLHYYRQFYDVLKDQDEHWLLASFLSAYAKAYDPHSDFMSARDREDFDIAMRLSLVGIGALLSREDGMARIERILPGGPAEADGRLQPGDRIVAVAQGDEEPVDILHWPLSRSVRLIRGAAGTRVVLHVLPAADLSGSTVRTIDLVRAEVRLEERAAQGSVHAVARPGEDAARRFGILRVPDFYADMQARGRQRHTARSVTRDTRAILRDFEQEGIEGVLIDLRNNGGGSFEEAVEFAGLFLPGGPVVQVMTREGVAVVRDLDPQVLYDGPLVVLVNRLSASASEIVAAALMDYGRALIVGDAKTHGKGTVQTLLTLNPYDADMGSLKVTTARFYRISGGSTQKRGVPPHIVLPSLLDGLDIGEEFLTHALPWSEIPPARYDQDRRIERWQPELQERAQRRRNEHTAFSAYAALVERMKHRRSEGVLPLDLDARLTQARDERAMVAYQRVERSREDEAAPVEQDPILAEALAVLADLVDRYGQAPDVFRDPAAAGFLFPKSPCRRTARAP